LNQKITNSERERPRRGKKNREIKREERNGERIGRDGRETEKGGEGEIEKGKKE